MRKKMTKDVKSILSKMPPEWNFFGFGSFFCSQGPFEDVDIVAVAPDDGEESMRYYELLYAELAVAREKYGIRFDLTMLTEVEFAQNPLRDMNNLQKL